MIDLPYSSRCRHHECGRRAVRAGLCPDHWQQLNGTGYGPWPDDVEPVGWRDQYLRRHGTPWVRVRDRKTA